MKKVTMNPTWCGVLPLLVGAYDNGSESAEIELVRMARGERDVLRSARWASQDPDSTVRRESWAILWDYARDADGKPPLAPDADDFYWS